MGTVRRRCSRAVSLDGGTAVDTAVSASSLTRCSQFYWIAFATAKSF